MQAVLTAPAVIPPTTEQLAAYRELGWLDWGPLLAEDELPALRHEYDRVLREAEERGQCRNLSANPARSADTREDGHRMLQIMQMCERSLAFRRLIHDERILEVVRALIGPDVMLFHDQALFKPAHTGGAVFWHQDNGYWGCTPAELISCWITLDQADAGNGAMQVIPGSHRLAADHGSDPASAMLQVDGIPLERAVVAALPAGGCMFHHCQTLHYTAPNHSDRPRRAFTIHYMPVGTRDRDGQVMAPSWSRPVLCCSPRKTS